MHEDPTHRMNLPPAGEPPPSGGRRPRSPTGTGVKALITVLAAAVIGLAVALAVVAADDDGRASAPPASSAPASVSTTTQSATTQASTTTQTSTGETTTSAPTSTTPEATTATTAPSTTTATGESDESGGISP